MNHISTKALFCVTGLTPQIVTETLYGLCVQQQPAWVPDRVVVLTTLEGKQRILQQLLAPEGGWFKAFCVEYGLVGRILFDESCVLVPTSKSGTALDDVRTVDDNVCMGDAIMRTIQTLVGQFDAVHVSIAGGRKTMGYYAGSALSLHGRAQDRMSHVLVNEPFEQAPAFYYPPARAVPIALRDGSTVSSSKAHIMLADMPFLRLGSLLHKDLRQEHLSFEAMVAQLQSSLSAVWVSIDLEQRTVTTPHGAVRLEPLRFAIFCWFAVVKKYRLGRDGGLANTDVLYKAYFYSFMESMCLGTPAFNRSMPSLKSAMGYPESFRAVLDVNCTHIRKAFKLALGPIHAALYDISAYRKDEKKQNLRELPTPSEAIFLPSALDWAALEPRLVQRRLQRLE